MTKTIELEDKLWLEAEKVSVAFQYATVAQMIAEAVQQHIKKLRDEAEDAEDLALALERKKNDDGVSYSREEIMQRHGISQKILDEMEDVELEYELDV